MSELDRLGELIAAICRLGATVVIVEHHLDLVANICKPRHRARSRHGARRGHAGRGVQGRAGDARPIWATRAEVGSAGMKRHAPCCRSAAVDAGYGHVARAATASISRSAQGRIVALVGSNGAGKTTLLRTLSGLLRPTRRRHHLRRPGHRRRPAACIVDARPAACRRRPPAVPPPERARQPRARPLRHAARPSRADSGATTRVYELFPVLGERPTAPAGILSGGQQQMLAIAQAMMREPKLLMLDEPSLGLAPIWSTRCWRVLHACARGGIDHPAGRADGRARARNRRPTPMSCRTAR